MNSDGDRWLNLLAGVARADACPAAEPLEADLAPLAEPVDDLAGRASALADGMRAALGGADVMKILVEL